MSNHAPNENFAHHEQSLESKNLQKELKNFLKDAANEMIKNPEIAENIDKDFSEMSDSVLKKNPDGLLENIDQKMKSDVLSLVQQVKNGEIYAKDGKEQAKNIITHATELKLYIVQKIQNFTP